MNTNKGKTNHSPKQIATKSTKSLQNPLKINEEINPLNQKESSIKQVNQKELSNKSKPQINTSIVKNLDQSSSKLIEGKSPKQITEAKPSEAKTPKKAINSQLSNVKSPKNKIDNNPSKVNSTPAKPSEKESPKKTIELKPSSINKLPTTSIATTSIKLPISRQQHNSILQQNSKLFETNSIDNLGKSNNDYTKNNKEEDDDKYELPETIDHLAHLRDEEDNYTIKPRVNYLKGKINEMNFNKNLVAGVSRGLNVSLMSIKDGFITSQLPQSHSQLNILSPKAFPLKPRFKSNTTRLHTIKELKDNEIAIKNSINQLSQNQKLLENESYFNISSQSEQNTVNITVRKAKIKDIKTQKEQLINHLMQIASTIALLTEKESFENGQFNNSIKYNLSKFEENFEKDKEIVVRKIRYLQKESFSRQQRMNNDLNEKLLMRDKQIRKREKSEEEKKMLMIENLRQQEKDIILKRHQQNHEKIMKIRDYFKEKIKNKSYAYLNLNRRYQAHENQLVQMETIRRRDYMKHIKSEDLNEFSHKVHIDKGKMEEELIEKGKKLHELWNERSKLKPEYVHPMYLKCKDEKAIEQALEEEKKEQEEINRKKMKTFACDIAQPKPNVHLINDRMEKISKVRIRRTLQTRPRNNSHTNRNINPLDSSQTDLKMKDINTVDMKDYPQHKPNKLLKRRSEFTRRRSSLTIKPVDYLEERRKMKCSKEIDWNREISKEKERTSLQQGLMHIHDKAALMDIKIKQKEQLLRLNGGVGQHPEICEEVSDLMINSIKAKLSIIDSAVNVKENEI